MKPIDFDEANFTLRGGPAEKYGTDTAVADLPTYKGDGMQISCWGMTWRERLSALFHGKAWLRVAGETHPPLALDCCATVFSTIRPPQ